MDWRGFEYLRCVFPCHVTAPLPSMRRGDSRQHDRPVSRQHDSPVDSMAAPVSTKPLCLLTPLVLPTLLTLAIRCGGETVPIETGLRRRCVPNPSHKLYPRTDPVVIMLVESPDGHRCVGRYVECGRAVIRLSPLKVKGVGEKVRVRHNAATQPAG